MKRIRKKRRPYTLPTASFISGVIRRFMNRAADVDISEEDIFKKLSMKSGLSLNYFKTRRQDILNISDRIASELGLERDNVYNHFDVILRIIYQSIFEWPALPEEVQEREHVAFQITDSLVSFFDETGNVEEKYDLISLDDIYEKLISEEYMDHIDPELLAYGLIEVWDYLLDQYLIT